MALVNRHVNSLSEEDQKRWLKQRGWTETERGNMVFWRHPEEGNSYNFQVALRKAKEECKLPADFELTPTA